MRSGRTRLLVTLPASALCLLFAACDHSDPFDASEYGPTGPFAEGDPARLTFGGTARTPAWAPDGSNILLSFEDLSRADNDRCIGQLPRQGGSMTRVICHVGVATGDSLDQLESPALNEAGGLAYVRASRRRGSIVDRERVLVVTTWSDPTDTRRLLSIPFSVAGSLRTSIESLSWLDDERLVFVANGEAIVTPCEFCDPIVVESGRDIVVAGAGADLTMVPVAGNATSVAAAGGEVFYTLAGDSRIYRGTAAGGAAVVHDFGDAGIVRGVHVSGDWLVAIVGGLVQTYETPDGIAQSDEGGEIWTLQLPAGSPAPVPFLDHLFLTAAVSPDGSAIAGISVPIDIQPIYEGTEPVGLDTSVVGPPDLWRLGE